MVGRGAITPEFADRIGARLRSTAPRRSELAKLLVKSE
jgi:hypothetical protein